MAAYTGDETLTWGGEDVFAISRDRSPHTTR